MTRVLAMIPVLWLASCGGDAAGPVAIDARHDACAQCRMIVSDVRLAGEIVVPGEEPRVFDDIGCLRDYLAMNRPVPDAVVFVADHRTGEWIEARGATYTRTTSVYTPMGSRIVAHADARSRDADPAVEAGSDHVPASAIVSVGRPAGDRNSAADQAALIDRLGGGR